MLLSAAMLMPDIESEGRIDRSVRNGKLVAELLLLFPPIEGLEPLARALLCFSDLGG
jgi:hypothetical protein